jgi:hypothetical protein
MGGNYTLVRRDHLYGSSRSNLEAVRGRCTLNVLKFAVDWKRCNQQHNAKMPARTWKKMKLDSSTIAGDGPDTLDTPESTTQHQQDVRW